MKYSLQNKNVSLNQVRLTKFFNNIIGKHREMLVVHCFLALQQLSDYNTINLLNEVCHKCSYFAGNYAWYWPQIKFDSDYLGRSSI